MATHTAFILVCIYNYESHNDCGQNIFKHISLFTILLLLFFLKTVVVYNSQFHKKTVHEINLECTV